MPTRPRKSNVALILAHPDDEVLALPQLLSLGPNLSKLQLIYLTDGAGRSGRMSPTLRLQESHKFLARFGFCFAIEGVGSAMGIPDGRLHEHIRKAYLCAAEALDRDVDLVLAPDYEGGHQDHDSAFLLASLLAQNTGAPLYTFPLYRAASMRPFFHVATPANGARVMTRFVLPRADAWNFVVAYRSFDSQRTPLAGLMPQATVRTLLGAEWYLMQREATEVKETPNNGLVLYDRRDSLPHEDWFASVRWAYDHFLKGSS